MTTEAQDYQTKFPASSPFYYDVRKAEAYAKYWNEYDWGNRKKTHDS